MSSGLPCPNPACTHVFSQGDVAGASSLTCPECGTQFQFHAVPAAPAPASPRKAPAPAKVRPKTAATKPAVREPSGEPVPVMAEPLAPAASDHFFAVAPEVGAAHRRRRRQRPWWHRAIAALVGLGLLTAAGLWVANTLVPWAMDQLGHIRRETTPAAVIFKGLNCRFTPPGNPWKRDEAARPLGVATVLTMQRTNPNGWLALAAQDYKTRAPRDAEVVEENIQRLGLYFQNLETNYHESDELGGLRAQHLTFQGRVNQVLMFGDCYLLSAKGIVYCLAVWGPAESTKASREEFNELRKGFALLKEREGWTEEQPKEVQFDGHRASYSLRGPEGLWEEYGLPDKVDPKADLVLQAKDRIEDKHVDKMARVAVLVLEPQKDLGEAVKAARAHVEAQHKEIWELTTMAVMRDADGSQDKDMPVGNAAGHVVKLHVKNGQARERFLVLAVVPRPRQLIAIQCECDWKRRQSWAADFDQLLKTFRVQEK